MHDRDPYDEVIGTLATMNHAKQFGQATVRTYSAALRDVPLDELREVVWEIVKTKVFPPTVAEVLMAVAQRRLQLPEPMAAWEMLCDVVSKAEGFYDLPGPVQRAANAVGGPYTIKTTDNAIALRAHFLTAYREFRETAERETVLALDRTKQKEVTSGS